MDLFCMGYFDRNQKKGQTKGAGLPETVTIMEVGPRDGLQFEKKTLPTALKIQLITDLVAAGLKEIQVASFVNPARVPQMADADTLVTKLPTKTGVVYNGLVLNVKGVQRAAAAGLKSVEISISASRTHSRRNANMGVKEATAQAGQMIRLSKEMGLAIRGGVQCAFGFPDEETIPFERIQRILEIYLTQGIERLSLSDTTGMADPGKIHTLMEKLRPVVGGLDIALHLHDTRGLGLVNVQTALGYGIRHFDASLAGMGGCPFVPGAAGNIATEDLVNLLSTLHVKTHIDIKKLARCSQKMETFFGKRFPGRMYRLVV